MSIPDYLGNPKGTSQVAGSLLAQHVMLVDAGGNAVVFGSGGTSAADGAGYTQNTTTGTPMLGVYSASDRTIADGKLAVPSVDATGALKVTGGGGGTQYTEDAAAVANPQGGMLLLRRKDTLSVTEVSADGDVIAANATSKGELCVNAAALPLPTGAATESTVSAISGDLGDVADAIVAAGAAGSIAAKLRRISQGVEDLKTGITTQALPTGASTAAKQDTGNTSVGSIDTNTGAIADAVVAAGATGSIHAKLRRVTQGLEDLKSLTVLAAGANAIGKLAANGGVIIGDVNAVTVTPGTGATALGKAEDAAHASGDTGVMMLTVRRASPTDLSAGNTDGDYEPPQVNRDGALWTVGAAGPTGGWDVATASIGATKTDIGAANTPGAVGGWYFYNANAAVAYVQFFNAQASAVTLGTTAPVYSLGIPPGAAANIPAGMVGIKHGTAISIAITTTRAGSTGPAATVDFNIFYKQ